MRADTIRFLLLVDAEPDERRLVAATATRAGWNTLGSPSVAEAQELLGGPNGHEIRAVLIGRWDPHGGPGLVRALRADRPGLPIIVLAEGGSVGQAVEAMRAGASDFLVRPVAPERLMEALAVNADRRRAAGELAPLSEKLAPELSLDELVGAAPDFRVALAVAAKAARSRLALLIVGEAGTGKETIARAVHSASPRARGPFLQIDCRAVPANIIDSELFGHVAGAFPGAFAERVGKLVEADGGTLLLDEVGDLPPATQKALDRMLATGEVRPVGCNGSNSVDVRIIATSSKPLSDKFDPGLAERLGGTVVAVPSLRERSGDIPALARHLLARHTGQPGIRPLSIGEDALAVLMKYGWPGNVRQLSNVIFRAALQCQGAALTAEDFPHIALQSRFTNRVADGARDIGRAAASAALAGAPSITLWRDDGHLRPLEEIEADLIRLAIGHYRGKMTEVARRLGIGRSTLYRKLAELGIDTGP
ncbi:sigma-54-dependent transcriptional regulator [Sphingomonas astaxanthinifaciens]|uniref:DNA-binding transcriptional regulator NtrC n=1 Tax=Sphingomonas astaxanthinifaciens DSM 22298 TaxID=1123267 RepID=A0ABQ5Z8N1_9SPHN|nr:sigma-54 dependent transcriptional regulator [Sphingomonas astaxanthinifaciens]GLR47990.1 sigma-54-dependent Fis family transcriptional regulator [Sphingomonas astaxanthinifaciens DSM 22298]